jgi:hypothetical protein
MFVTVVTIDEEYKRIIHSLLLSIYGFTSRSRLFHLIKVIAKIFIQSLHWQTKGWLVKEMKWRVLRLGQIRSRTLLIESEEQH